jgi:hypothetical protein
VSAENKTNSVTIDFFMITSLKPFIRVIGFW